MKATVQEAKVSFYKAVQPYYCIVLGVWAIFMPQVAGRISGLVLTGIGVYMLVERWKQKHR